MMRDPLECDLQKALERELKRLVLSFTRRVAPSVAGFLASEPRKSRRGDWPADTVPQPNRKSGLKRTLLVRALSRAFDSPRQQIAPLVNVLLRRQLCVSSAHPVRDGFGVDHPMPFIFQLVSSVRRRTSFMDSLSTRRAMKQGRQAGGALDAPVVSPVPSERGPAAAARARVQPRESLAAAGALEADRHVVVDQSPAAPRQDGWAAGQARPLLRAAVGGEPPDSKPVRGDAPADLGAPGPGRLTRGAWKNAGLAKRGHKGRAVSKECPGSTDLQPATRQRGLKRRPSDLDDGATNTISWARRLSGV